MSQRFRANTSIVNQNGSISWGSNSPMDCLGHHAKIQNCPIIIGVGEQEKEVARLTCYAQGYADTWFSIPADTRYRGHVIHGYFTGTEEGPIFRVMDQDKHFFEAQP